MIIKIIQSFITEHGTLTPGEIVEIEDAIAQNWIECGLAVEIEESK